MKINLKISLLSFAFTYAISVHAFASDIKNEIDHLLAFVENTTCQYERNGVLHVGSDAVKHINTKYNYFKDEINSAESFIELSATKSTMSGKYYMILCMGEPAIKSQDWLLQELKIFRHKTRKESAESSGL